MMLALHPGLWLESKAVFNLCEKCFNNDKWYIFLSNIHSILFFKSFVVFALDNELQNFLNLNIQRRKTISKSPYHAIPFSQHSFIYCTNECMCHISESNIDIFLYQYLLHFFNFN